MPTTGARKGLWSLLRDLPPPHLAHSQRKNHPLPKPKKLATIGWSRAYTRNPFTSQPLFIPLAKRLPLLGRILLPLRYFQSSTDRPRCAHAMNFSNAPQMRRALMQKQEGKIGAIRRNVHGKACSYCGSRTYQLVLRSDQPPHAGKLFARCTQCQQPRELDEDIGRILWM